MIGQFAGSWSVQDATRREGRLEQDWCPPFDGFFLYDPSRRHQPSALQALVEALRI